MSSENIYNILDELEIEDETGKLKLSLVDCMIGNRTLIKTDLPYGVHVVL